MKTMRAELPGCRQDPPEIRSESDDEDGDSRRTWVASDPEGGKGYGDVAHEGFVAAETDQDVAKADECKSGDSVGRGSKTSLAAGAVGSTGLSSCPAMYSEAYFQDRIRQLTDDILNRQLPSNDELGLSGFLHACTAVKNASETLKRAQSLLDQIKKQKDAYSDDDAFKEACDMATAVCQAARKTLDETERTAEDVAATTLANRALSAVWDSILQSTVLECTLLIWATPTGLAQWVAENPSRNARLLDHCLHSIPEIQQIVLNSGPLNGHLGPYLELHDGLLMSWNSRSRHCTDNSDRNSGNNGDSTNLPSASPTTASVRMPDALAHRLIRAVALQFTEPIYVFAHKPSADSPGQTIDPYDRFWHYVNAYERNELDAAFPSFSVWEMRMVIDSDAPSDQLQWGRDTLKAYHPDQFLRTDRWQYCFLVRSDLGYRTPEGPMDSYPDLVSSGGECGARAWFGRFMCKTFGIPTWGVRQPGHAAMSRWVASEGWVTCLGRSFDCSWWDDTRYTGGRKKVRQGLDFLSEYQSRATAREHDYYRTVSILECIAEVAGQRVMDQLDPDSLWRSLSMAQRNIYARRYVVPKPSKDPEASEMYVQPRESLITVSDDGTIIVNAASFSSSSKANVQTMPSFLEGGQQLHLTKDGSVTYTLPDRLSTSTSIGSSDSTDTDRTVDGKTTEIAYTMAVRYVNVHRRQVPLQVTVDGPSRLSNEFAGEYDDCSVSSTNQCFAIPIVYTRGSWYTSKPVSVTLSAGCTVTVTREVPCFGLSIKDFIFRPASTVYDIIAVD